MLCYTATLSCSGTEALPNISVHGPGWWDLSLKGPKQWATKDTRDERQPGKQRREACHEEAQEHLESLLRYLCWPRFCTPTLQFSWLVPRLSSPEAAAHPTSKMGNGPGSAASFRDATEFPRWAKMNDLTSWWLRSLVVYLNICFIRWFATCFALLSWGLQILLVQYCFWSGVCFFYWLCLFYAFFFKLSIWNFTEFF